MATKDDLISGLEMLIREGRRAAADLTDDQWSNMVDFDGWKNREVLAHVASLGPIVQPMLTSFVSAPTKWTPLMRSSP